MLFNSLNGQIFFSEYVEGSSYNKYIEIYNYSSENINLQDYKLLSCTNGCIGGNNIYGNDFPEDALLEPGQVYVIAATQADQQILNEADYTFQYCCGNGDDAYALIPSNLFEENVFDVGNVLDLIGGPDIWEEGVGWDVGGVEQATENHTLIRKSSVSSGNAGNWSLSAGTNSDDSEWIVLDQDNFSNLGFHNYDGSNSSDIYGCMCEEASNYMPTATLDDGSCIVDNGCSDPLALNYSGFLCDSAEFVNENCQYETIDISGCYWCDLAINYFDFNYQITASNMTIAITDISDLINGDVVGVFYVSEEGYVRCGGASVYDGSQNIAIAAWGDDPSSVTIDGFQSGDSFIFLILRDDIVYISNSVLNNTDPYTNTYANNNFGQVLDLDISSEFTEDCWLPLGVSEDCEPYYNISEYNFDNKIILNVDLLGRAIQTGYQGFGFSVYKNGVIEKKYFSNH